VLASIPERVILALHRGEGPFETTIESAGGLFDLASVAQSEHHRGQVLVNHHPQLEKVPHFQEIVRSIALALAKAGRQDVLFLQPSQDLVSSIVGADGIMPVTIGRTRSCMAHFLNGGLVASTRTRLCRLSDGTSDDQWEDVFEASGIHCFPRVRNGRAVVTTANRIVAVDLMSATNIAQEPRKVKRGNDVRKIMYIGRLGGDSKVIATAWQKTPTQVELTLWPDDHVDLPIQKVTAAMLEQAVVA